MPAGSPASASSISGGSTWPKPTDHVGPGVSNEDFKRAAGRERQRCGQGSRRFSPERSQGDVDRWIPVQHDQAGVRPVGWFLSPSPHKRAKRSRDATVRPSTPSMADGSRTCT